MRTAPLSNATGRADWTALPVSMLCAGALAVATSGCRCEGPAAGDSGASGMGPVLLADAGSGPCPHPYLPLVEGARWSYELGAAEQGRTTRAEIEVLEVSRRGSGLTAKLRRTVGSMVTQVEAVCGSDGTSFLAAFVPLGPPLPVGVPGNPTVTERTDAMLPPVSRLRDGEGWTYELTAHTALRGPTPLTMDSQWEARGAWQRETRVTVPAGTYDVAQVRYDVTVHHRPPAEEDVVFSDRVMDPPPMTFTYSLARGVGVVLIEGEPQEDRPHVRARWALTSVARAGDGSP